MGQHDTFDEQSGRVERVSASVSRLPKRVKESVEHRTTDQDANSPTDRWRSSTARIALTSTIVVMLSALLVELSSGTGQAASTVGFVLVEALLLYVGYGTLTKIASPSVHELLTGT